MGDRVYPVWDQREPAFPIISVTGQFVIIRDGGTVAALKLSEIVPAVDELCYNRTSTTESPYAF